MKANGAKEVLKDIADEVYQLAADIDNFWCDFDPYNECHYGRRNNKEIEENILHIASDIYFDKTDTIEMLQECTGNFSVSESSENAKKLLRRISDVRAKINNPAAGRNYPC